MSDVRRYYCADGECAMYETDMTENIGYGLYVNYSDYQSEKARADAAEADARRYRWLRDPNNMEGPGMVAMCDAEELDAAIDAAIGATHD